MAPVPVYLVGGCGNFRRKYSDFIEGSRFDVAGDFDCPEACADDSGGAHSEIVVCLVSGDAGPTGQTVHRVASIFPDARILVLSSGLSFDEFTAALRAGARGYLHRDIAEEVLINALELVSLGESVFPSKLRYDSHAA